MASLTINCCMVGNSCKLQITVVQKSHQAKFINADHIVNEINCNPKQNRCNENNNL